MIYILLLLSVAFGFGVAVLFQHKGIKHMPIILAFSGAFLLSVTLFELLPEVFDTPAKHIGMYIMGGILLQIVLDFFSKGAEHGHVHLHGTSKAFPWLLFISLSIHALLEGFPIVNNSSVMIGVIIHKIPIVIILTLFFLKANYPKNVTVVFLFLFALMTPLGSFMSVEIEQLKSFETPINAITIGVFLHVSTTILFESSKDHKFNMAKLAAIVLGIIIAYFV